MGLILLCCLPFGNAGGLQILRCQGFEVKYYDFTLDALTLKPSDVCNVGVYPLNSGLRRNAVLKALKAFYEIVRMDFLPSSSSRA
jgi:hypothetical protein